MTIHFKYVCAFNDNLPNRTRAVCVRASKEEKKSETRSQRVNRVILKYFATANRKSTINVFTLKAFALTQKGLISASLSFFHSYAIILNSLFFSLEMCAP